VKLDEEMLNEVLENLKEVKRGLGQSKELREETRKSLERAQEQIEKLNSPRK
jgi:hypothetical protein